MSLFSLLSVAVLAAERIISPLPDSYVAPPIPQPHVSFGQLTAAPVEAPISQYVLGDETTAILAEPTEEPVTTHTPEPTPVAITRKQSYTIALLGDSMIDTLGPDIPHLKKKLTALYPGRSFTLYNYGVGATNIDYGLERITNGYTYLGTAVPSLISRHPDIVVVESFGYNPYTYDAGAIDRHWLQLAAVVDTLRRNIPGVRIIIASTIAPSSKKFGDGAPGLSFAADDKFRRTQVIKSYLDSTVKFAKSEHLPLADAYHASLDRNGDGILTYINGGDHIHYSDAGRALFAAKVADAIAANKLLE